METVMKKITLPPEFAGVTQSSLAARVGLRLIQSAAALRAASPLIAAGLVCLIEAAPALAQQPTGGSILGNNADRPVGLIKRGVDVFSWLMIIAGIIGIGRGVIRGMRGGEGWGAPAGWGAAGLGFGYLVSWVNAEVNGNNVALPNP
jgi:hypothetical protein